MVVPRVSSKFNMYIPTNTKFKLKRRDWRFEKTYNNVRGVHSAVLKKVKYH